MKKYPKIRKSKAWIAAINELIEIYEVGERRGITCPFCVLARTLPPRKLGACKKCLWILFEKKACIDTPHYADISLKSRIKRLCRWKQIITKQTEGKK